MVLTPSGAAALPTSAADRERLCQLKHLSSEGSLMLWNDHEISNAALESEGLGSRALGDSTQNGFI